MAQSIEATTFWAYINTLCISPNQQCFQPVPPAPIHGQPIPPQVCDQLQRAIKEGSRGKGIRMVDLVALHNQTASHDPSRTLPAFMGYWDGAASPGHKLKLLDFRTLAFSITTEEPDPFQ